MTIQITLKNGRYLSDMYIFSSIYQNFDDFDDIDENFNEINLLPPNLELYRSGGDKYSRDPYLYFLKFQIVNKNDNGYMVVKEFFGDYDLTKSIKRELSTLYYLPIPLSEEIVIVYE